MKIGEVYYLRADNSYGYEEAIGRPVLVFAGNERQMKNDDDPGMVTVAFMSTSPKNIGINVQVNSTNRKSWVLCNQIKAIDGRRLRDKMCDLSPVELEDVRDGLREALNLTVQVKDGGDLEKENRNLKLELEIQKKMYDRVLGLLVEERVSRDMGVKTPEVVVAPEPIDIDTELLKVQMSTPNKLLDDPQENKVKTKLKPKKLSKAKVSEKKANVNTDGWETIWEATGINEQAAKNIVAYRNKHGRFVSLEDLMMVPRFGRVMLKRCEGLLEV